MQKCEMEHKQVESDIMPENSSAVKLHIVVHDKNGKFVSEKFIDNDMYLDQWGAIIAALFKNLGNATYTLSTTYSCKNSAGTSILLGGVNTNNSPFMASALEGLVGQLKVAVGTGTNAAVHTDYWLQTPVTGASAYPAAVTETNPSGSILYVSFSATITIAAGAAVTEAIVTLIVLSSTAVQQGVSITHDVFSVVNVPAGGSITLNYTFQFNTV